MYSQQKSKYINSSFKLYLFRKIKSQIDPR